MKKNLFSDPSKTAEDITPKEEDSDELDESVELHDSDELNDSDELVDTDELDNSDELESTEIDQMEEIEDPENDSISKLYVIIYALSFIIILSIVAIIILSIFYCKNSTNMPKEAVKLKPMRNQEIEPELSTHLYEPVYDYDYASNSGNSNPRNFPRTQFDHLKFSRAAKPNSPISSHIRKMHARNVGGSSHQN